jgi:hypothetical protein
MKKAWHHRFLLWIHKSDAQLYFLIGLVTAIFVSLRLYQLPRTLFFFNDMGRDLLVLWQSWEAKKPFLLGPQNSALPFNQPALYFYALYPIFLLSRMSLYTHTLTFWLITGSILLFLAKLLWSWRIALRVFVGAVWLMAIQPEYVIQNRFIWNPSFVAPFTLLAFFAYWKTQNFTAHQSQPWKWIWLWAFGLATALAFSYSVIPIVAAFVLLILWQWRWQAWKFAVALGSVSVFWQLPTLAFEFRYHWQLTRAVFSGVRPTQVGISAFDKLLALQDFFWHTTSPTLATLATFFLIGVLLINIWLVVKKNHQTRDEAFVLAGILSLLTLVITLVIPVGVQSHYVFGLFTLLLILLASLRKQLLIITFCLLAFSWLQPGVVKTYWKVPWRTVADLSACGQLVCSQIHEPVFVSTQSNFHPFHNGPEWRFIFAKSGCQVKAIETENGLAQTMLVVADNGEYQHGKTTYNELSLFGADQASESGVITCPAKVKVHVLKKM